MRRIIAGQVIACTINALDCGNQRLRKIRAFAENTVKVRGYVIQRIQQVEVRQQATNQPVHLIQKRIYTQGFGDRINDGANNPVNQAFRAFQHPQKGIQGIHDLAQRIPDTREQARHRINAVPKSGNNPVDAGKSRQRHIQIGSCTGHRVQCLLGKAGVQLCEQAFHFVDGRTGF